MRARWVVLVIVALVVAILAPEVQAGVTSLALHGETGDPIVGADSFFYTPAQGTFFAQRNPDSSVSIFFLEAYPGRSFWHLNFAGPHHAPLTNGVYEGATLWPYQTADAPGLNVWGEPSGVCSPLTGRFEIKEIAYGPDNTIPSFWAVVEQHCGGLAPAAFAEIRINATVIVDVTAPARATGLRDALLTFEVTATDRSGGGAVSLSALNLPAGATFADHGNNTGTFAWTPPFDQVGGHTVTFRADNGNGQTADATTRVIVNGLTSLRLRGDPGDVVVGTKRRYFTPEDGLFQVSGNFFHGVSLRFLSMNPGSWFVDFAAANSVPLEVGFYTATARFPLHDPANTAMNVSGEGTGCSSLTGQFEVKEIRYGEANEIEAAWVVFEQHCRGAVPAAFGEFRYNANSVDLTVIKGGTGQGTVTAPGIDCGLDCSRSYRPADETPVLLTAAPVPLSRFTGWSGACGGSGPCMVTMSHDRTVTANFELIPFYELTVTKVGGAPGRVTSDVPGIDCGPTCSAQYIENTTVTLTAVPDSGFAFTGWTGACSGTGPCTVQMTAARTVSASFSHRPDLRVSALTAPATARTGQPLAVASTVTNDGTASAGPFTVTFYLSPADSTPGAGAVLGARAFPTLAAGASMAVTTPISIPLGFTPGTYFLSAVADSGAAVAEASETNNGWTAAPVTVFMHRADLAVTALTAPATVRTGQPLAVTNTVKNTGQAAAPAFRVTFYLSAPDSTPGAGIAVGSRMLGGLAAGASSMATTPATIPLGFEPGVYFLSAVVNDPRAVIEIDDTNNSLTAPAQVAVLMHRADLTLTALSAPATGRTGQPLLVSSTVKNVGPAAAPAFRVRFYLSPISGAPGAGMAVGARMLGGLAAGATSTVTTPVTIPLGLEPGAYFLSAVADDNDVVVEGDETNNGLTAAAQVAVLMFRPDLTVTGLTTAETARTGQALPVVTSVKNVGQTAAPAFRVTFYLSATDSTPGAGLAVGSRTISGLGVNASTTTTTPVGVPLGLPPGPYFLSAVADDNGAVIEADETNNGLTAAAVVPVVMFRADLRVDAVSAPATGRTGQPLAVTHTIRNGGQSAAPAFRVTFYMSTTDSTPGAGLPIGARTYSGLGAGMNISATTPVIVPPGLDPGTYFLSAVVDDAGALIEVGEGNNGLTATAPVTILMHRPDLTVTAIMAPATGQTSRPLAVTSTVQNIGQAAAPALRVTFYLSAADSTPGAGLAIGSRTVAGLAAGGVSTVTTPVTIPSTGVDAGTYFLSALAAPTVPTPEVDATNNGLTSSTPVTVEVYRPDLSITNVTAPADAAVTGRPLVVAATLKNTGPAPAAAFRVSFYLSTNETLAPGDTLIGSQSVGGLAPNVTFTTTVHPIIPPALPPGNYFVIASVDDDAKITELAEDNNVRAMPAATAVVPLMVRTYRVMLTLTTSACSDPGFDGTDTGPITLRIPTQSGGAFSGTFGFSGSVDGVTVVTTFSLSGAVGTTGGFDGGFSVNTVGGGFSLLEGRGSFSGSINGAMLVANLTGGIAILGPGEDCTLTASMVTLP